MSRAGLPTLVVLGISVILPVLGRGYLNDQDFAMWAILATVGSVGVTFDMGGPQMTAALMPGTDHGGRLFWQSSLLSAIGAMLVGFVGALLWLPYSSTAAAGDWTLAAGMLAIAFMALGSAARSVTSVAAAAYLVVDRHRARASVLVGQAVAQLFVLVACLEADFGVWSLPLSLVLSSAGAAVWSAVALRTTFHATHGDDPERSGRDLESLRGSIRRFASARTVALALSVVLTQGDRWVIGALGGATTLANYELAWRFAVAPKLLAIALVSTITPDTARILAAKKAQHLRAMNRHATIIVAAAVTAGSLAVVCVALIVVPLLVTTPSADTISVMLVPLLVAHGLHSVTAPGTHLAAGVGRPEVELGYLAVGAGVTAVGWTAAFATSSVEAAIAAVVSGLVLGSLWFLSRQPHLRDVP